MKKRNQQISRCEDARACLSSAIHILDQGLELLSRVTDEVYQRSLTVASGASIGGHYRHCLDHFHCLLQGRVDGLVDYDLRQRDAEVERDREMAQQATEAIRERLCGLLEGGLLEGDLDQAIAVRCKVHYASDEGQQVMSTWSREIMYVVAHAVHHFALIAVMAKVLDFRLPDEFGVAPSTLQHRAELVAEVVAEVAVGQ